MKETSKRTLKNVFASLISNDAAIDGAKTAPWWIGIIFLIIGTFLPIIPIMVNNSKTYGASFMAKNTYGYEQALATVSNELEIEHYTFTVNDNKKLVAAKDGVVIENTVLESKDLTPIATYDAYENVNGEDKYYRALNVFYTDRASNKISAFRKEIEKKQYYLYTDVIVGTAGDTESETYKDYSKHIPSYLILYKDGLFSKIYKYHTTTVGSYSYDGSDWKKFNSGTELLSLVNTVTGFEVADPMTRVKDINYVNGVKSNWSRVFNLSYKNQKVRQFWFSSGLYYGIYLVLAFFMGLLMFLLTRGKNNPNRNITLWIGFKISMWIDFTPGLLAMVLGFVWSPTAGIGYIALIGIRTMWLSMRQLNPTANQ